jgi:hypothetical protein
LSVFDLDTFAARLFFLVTLLLYLGTIGTLGTIGALGAIGATGGNCTGKGNCCISNCH